MHCPTCKKQFNIEETTAPPFCSPRCRQIDLGRWLSEEQRLPAKSLEIEDEPDEGGSYSTGARADEPDEE